jgi:hypothetical protein
MWCTANRRRFRDLDSDLVDYKELGNAINTAREVFREVGYRAMLIPDALWEDPGRRPKIVRHLIMGAKTPEFLARVRAQDIAERVAEAPYFVV